MLKLSTWLGFHTRNLGHTIHDASVTGQWAICRCGATYRKGVWTVGK